MIRLYQEFDSEAAAIAWRDQMYQAYHPAGYSTHIQIKKVTSVQLAAGTSGERWIAHGSRAESCD